MSVFTDAGKIDLIEVGFDANDRTGTFITEVCLCLRQLDAKLIDHDSKVIPPEPALVAAAIAASDAAKFVATPYGYLDSLKTRTQGRQRQDE